MRMLAVNEIEDGMILGKSLFTGDNTLLLGAGFRLQSGLKSKLITKGYTHIYIMEEGTDDIIPEDIISDEVRMQARMNLADKADKIQDYLKFKDFSKGKVYDLLHEGYLKDFDITLSMRNTVLEILKDITSAGAKFMNTVMFKSSETYYQDHAINTTVLSILIGKQYMFSKAELMDLALGAFLHDFGKTVIERLKGNADKETIKDLTNEHPTFGYLMVRESRWSSPQVTQIINQHHENQDGTGYPRGLMGQNLPPQKDIIRESKGHIFRLAEIVTVADAYDNMLLNPRDKMQKTPSDAVRHLVKNAGTMYNKDIVKTITEIIPQYPVGVYVEITNFAESTFIGYRGVVAKINEDNLNKPVIVLMRDKHGRRIPRRIVDTSKMRIIKLRLIL